MEDLELVTESRKTTSPGTFMYKYLPYWPLFVLLFLIGGLCGWLYLRYTTPLYQATATILIKDEKKGVDESKILESINNSNMTKIVENELQVLQSRAVMKEVVNNLCLYAPVKEEERIKTVSAYTTSPISIAVQDPDHLKEVSKVSFTYHAAKREVQAGGVTYPLNNWVNTPYGVLKFTENGKKNSSPNGPLFFALQNPKSVTETFLGNLSVSALNKQSTVINLKFVDEVPERGEDILNEITKVYTQAAINDKNVLAANTLAFIDERMQYVEHGLDSINQQIQHFKSANEVVDLSTQGKLFLENVSYNDQKASDVSMQLAVLDQVEKYVVTKDNKAGIVPATLGVNDPLLMQMLQRLNEKELEYQSQKLSVGENNLVLTSLQSEINQLRPSILENIQNHKASLSASRSDLYSTNQTFASKLQTLPVKERELLEISRQQAIKSNVYSFLLQKREETAIAYASTVADNRIVDKAEASPVPISPHKKSVYLLSFAAAFVLGLGVVKGRETLNHKISSVQEIEDSISFPVIGEIPYTKTKNSLVLATNDDAFISEQFRRLRATLIKMSATANAKTLLITSSVSGDGKSFTVANLGLTFAMAGKKVVLLEFDLRNPSLSKKGDESRKGLTDYLSGHASLEEIIQTASANENLSLISAGTPLDNPSELIMSNRTKELFDYLKTLFDYILVDSAPVCLLSDAYILSNYCDATLYVVRQNHTPKVFLQRMDKSNAVTEMKNTLVVFNSIRSRRYNQEYAYGYNYIYKQKDSKRQLKQKAEQSFEL